MLWVTLEYAGATEMAVTVGQTRKLRTTSQRRACRTSLASPAAVTTARIWEGNAWRGNYCLVPVKVPSPNCPSDTLPLMVLPSVLPEYFTARL